MSNEIIKILDDLSKRIGVAVDWSGENVMPYLEELMKRFIQWEIVTSTVWVVIGIVLFICGLYCTKSIWKRRNNYAYFGDFDEGVTWRFIISISAMVCGAIIFYCQCFDICEAVCIPEKTIYDHITFLIRTSK